MRVSDIQSILGKFRESSGLTRAFEGKTGHFRIRSWKGAVGGSALSVVALSSVLSISYLVLRGDLIDASMTHQAALRQAHDDRVAALRAQVDRVTSRKMLDRQSAEENASGLDVYQSEVFQAEERLSLMLDDAEAIDDEAADETADTEVADAELAVANRGFRASLPVAAEPVQGLAGDSPFAFWSARDALMHNHSLVSGADHVVVAINQALRGPEHDQLTRITTLAQNAAETAEAIAQALEDANLKVDSEFSRQGVGGPFIAAGQMMMFDAKVKELDEALKHLEAMKETARKYPIANPAPGRGLSSNFGVRRDPFNGMAAMHAGLDFPAPSGTPALATASGTVVRAGWAGGYGRMVEVKHANGFSTRYGHLSKIRVKVGQKISTGDRIGDIGSTGRSTGPHLHYEIRRNGNVVDPISFLKAGRKVEKFL